MSVMRVFVLILIFFKKIDKTICKPSREWSSFVGNVLVEVK